MKELTYTIEFFSEWHCGSGLAAGADTDALVIKDIDGLPYVPGKTVKGLFREAAEDLIDLKYTDPKYTDPKYTDLKDAFNKSFGLFSDKDDAVRGEIFFSNAELNEVDRDQITRNKLTKFLYSRLHSTKINDNGTAEDGSLRSIETVVPCKLHGRILGVNADIYSLLTDATKMIKHIGVNRNRGLGRVKVTISEDNQNQGQR
jgi:CRISPR/Cas system CSM-associated protein Csm3 (group 7 of RAMP superfamily)